MSWLFSSLSEFCEETLAWREQCGDCLPAIQEFLRFVQGVFDELNARYTDQEESAPAAKLTDKSIEVSIILGFCHQHPRSTIYQETAYTYGATRSLRTPLSSGGAGAPTQKQQGNEGTSRFRH